MSDTGRHLPRRVLLTILLGFSIPDASAQSLCTQLEAQLARIGGTSTLDRAYGRQRAGYDRVLAASRAQGCDLTGPRPGVCTRLRVQLSQAESALRRIDQQRSDRLAQSGGQRDSLIRTLERHGCRSAAVAPQQRDFFSMLFGRHDDRNGSPPEEEQASVVQEERGPSSGMFRTLCVRTCDGYYWPMSFGVSSRSFSRDSKLCQASCPNQEVQLYVHRAHGEWSDKAVSLDGTPYAKQSWAFAYRTAYKRECACSAPALVATPGDAGNTSPMLETVPPSAASIATAAPPAEETVEAPPEASDDRELDDLPDLGPSPSASIRRDAP